MTSRRQVAIVTDSVSDLDKDLAAAHESGHFRILLRPAPDAEPGSALKVVHVRDTLLVDPATAADTLTSDVLQLEASLTLQKALERMRAASKQLAVVVPDEGRPAILGVLTASDFLDQIWPTIEEGFVIG